MSCRGRIQVRNDKGVQEQMTEVSALDQSQASGREFSFALVVSRFNRAVTGKLLEGCRRALLEREVEPGRIEVVWVPGAWELPLVARRLAETGDHDAVIALGAVIRGQTAHFDFICTECARGLQQSALDTGTPVLFGVLTCENGEQALDRADPERRDKGREVAEAAIEMAALMGKLAPPITERYAQ